MRRIAGIILVILAIVMIYIGIANQIVPPALTGVGFIVIAFVFIKER